jgi:DNA-binding LacI/PurR family transcriptional regulator
MALGLLSYLHEIGRAPPRDISIVGFDDIPESAYFTPPLTTVRQDFAEVGRRCLYLLLGQIDSGSRSWSRVVVPTELVLRRSTASPR